ncbi:MAG: hypothetical protein WCI71_06530 [Bacteroidota bacterium]
MRSRVVYLIRIFFLVLAFLSLDHHLACYFPCERDPLIVADVIPEHADPPVKIADDQEDSAFKNSFCSVPVPDEFPIHLFLILSLNTRWVFPGNIWQPPENQF